MATSRNRSFQSPTPVLAALAATGLIVLVTLARQDLDGGGRAMANGNPAPPVPVAAEPAPRVRSTTAVPALQSAPSQSFTRDENGLHVSVNGMPRAMAAERLASLTRSRIIGGADLLALASPLDLHWEGSDPAEAWKRVLGDDLRYSIRCDGGGCAVRILSIADVEGGTVLVPEPVQASKAGDISVEPGLMNRPTDPEAIDESALGP